MVYDTLVRHGRQTPTTPQMVSKYGASDDQLTWMFELRDG